MVHCVYERRKL